MNAVSGMPEFIGNLPGSKTKLGKGLTKGASFGSFFEQWMTHRLELGNGKISWQNSSAQEMSLHNLSPEGAKLQFLLKTLDYLANFKERLLNENAEQKLDYANLSLQELIDRLKNDQEFVASLPDGLKELFSSQSDHDLLNVADLEKRDELFQTWLNYQKKQDANLLAEVDELIHSIQESLTLPLLADESSSKQNMEVNSDVPTGVQEIQDGQHLSSILALERINLNTWRVNKNLETQDHRLKLGTAANVQKIGFESDLFAQNKASTEIASESFDQIKAKLQEFLNQQDNSSLNRSLIEQNDFGFAQKSETLLVRIAGFLNSSDGNYVDHELNSANLELKKDLQKLINSQQRANTLRSEDQLLKLHYASTFRANSDTEETIVAEFLQNFSEKGFKNTANQPLRLVAQTKKQEESHLDLKSNGVNPEVHANSTTQLDDFKSAMRSVMSERLINQPQAEEVFQQIVEGFQLELNEGVSKMELKLYPEELGRLILKLTVEDGIVAAKIVAETLSVKDLIEQNLPQLKESFAKEGIVWDEVAVDVGHEGLNENPFTYQGQTEFSDNRQRFATGEDEFDLAVEELTADEPVLVDKGVRNSNRLVDYLV